MRYRIKEFREKRGLSQEQLGAIIGVHWQTVHRAETGKSALSDSKLAAYAEALGIAPADLLPTHESARFVKVRGYVQAGHWAETWEWPSEDQYDVAVPNFPDLAPYQLYGGELLGPSMNKWRPEGTAIVFTHAVETHEDFIVGKRYVIERERADGLREATVKTLWRDEAGKLWLVPESDDPRFQEAIPVNGGENDTIRIIGRVRYTVTRE